MNKKETGKKLVDVSVLDVMKGIVDRHTKHFKSDFDYDIERIKKVALKEGQQEKCFIWLCRECGTWLLQERDVFIRETGDYNILMYYEWQKADKILAFAAEINAVNGSRVMGNIYSLDFEKYCKHVQEAAVPAGSIVLCYENGRRIKMPSEHFSASPDKEFGKFENFEFQTESEEGLRILLREERQDRQQFQEVSVI